MEKIKQMLSPGHSKDDEVMYGDPNVGTAPPGEGSRSTATRPVGQDTESNLQSLGNDKYGGTKTATSGIATSGAKPAASAIPTHLSAAADDNASTQSIRSGVVGGGPSAVTDVHSTDTSGAAGNFTKHDLPDRTAERSFPLGSSEPAGQSHLGRDAALAGGVGAAEAGAYKAGKSNEPAGTIGPDERLAQDSYEPTTAHQHKGHGHKFEGDPCPPGDEPQERGYPHHYGGPHSTDTANRLDPHVPGEFPSDSSEDIHARSGNTRGSNVTGGAATLGSTQPEKSVHKSPATGDYDDRRSGPAAAHSHHSSELGSIGHPSSTSNAAGASTSSEHSRDGRGAAVGTAAGVAGIGAYEASKDRRSGPTETGPASKTVGPHNSNAMNIMDPRVLPEPENQKGHSTTGPYQSDTLNKADPRVDSTKSSEQKSHHPGRDAAITGGTGAAGVGAYEATHHAGSTQQHPASSTTGTHQSTAGSHQSDTLNRADPRVDSDLSKADKEHHYGRDAGVAGGAGAVGLAGYEATKQDRLAHPQTAEQPLATPTGASKDARIFDQTQRVPDQKQAGGGWATDTKAQEKLEKERAKEADKAHDKAVKGNKPHVKQADKAHEKVLKDEEKGDKKHGLFGFLHRDKNDTQEEKGLKEQGKLREADQAAHTRHQHELEAAAAAGTVGVAGASFEPSLREQQENPDASSALRVSTDEKGHNKLHKDPPAKVQRELDEKSREQGTFGGASSGTAGGNTSVVTEHHTGLPMDLSKGTGLGGTDGSTNIHGYQHHS